jgi:pimeloyl-ACP methyl ester carboxylesterase
MICVQVADARPRTVLWRRLRRLLITVPLMAAAMLALMPDTARAHRSSCQRYDARVALTADTAVRYRVAGWLCRPSRPSSVVQILLSGFTYDHTYWDTRHSYLRAALSAGTAVYTVDRLGVGLSDRPPADEVTAASEAYVAHQLVQQLRQGRGGFRQVVGVGHSYGSAVWMIEAAGHHDVDALVLTGYLHQSNPLQVAAIGAGLHPASQDRMFADNGVPEGYVTTKPGTRAGAFYYAPGADPGAIERDERTKALGTTGQRASMNLARDPIYSRHLTAPVLLVVGDHDALSCDNASLPCGTSARICAREQAFYRSGSKLYAAVIPNTGHSINGHRSAPIEFAIVNAWIRTAMLGQAAFPPGCLR